MADGAVRRLMRRLIPRRLRWLVRAAFKRITGLYYRDITARLDTDVQHYFEIQGEVLDLVLRRLRISQEEAAAHLRAVDEHVATKMRTLEEQAGALQHRLEEAQQTLHSELVALRSEVTAHAQRMTPLPAKLAIQQPISLAAGRWGKIAILCRSLGRRCGIAEYCEMLAERLGGLPVSCAADLPEDADIVLVQYEPALYERPAELIDEVTAISQSAIVVVDAHQISPELTAELRWHAIVGTRRDLYPGTVRLSLALPVPPAAEAEPVDGIHLGSFGFAFPAKRYEMVIALAQRLGIRATIFAAHNNATPALSEHSSSYLARIKGLAGGDIEIIDDFLPPQEVIRQLRRCSHLISCMDDLGAQSSSLRTMAAAGRPLIALRTEQGREVGAILVDDLDSITLEFLEGCRQLPQPNDGIDDYCTLLQRLAWAKSLAPRIQHGDSIYVDDPRQMERLAWLRQNVDGKAIDIGIGNGFSTNYIRAVAGVEIRADRLAYASLRYPHIDFRLLDAKVHALPGFDTVVIGEIVEHMPLAEATEMLALWARTGPARMLLTTPNAGKPDYDPALVHNPEHVWEPREELIPSLIPAGYHADVATTNGGDFFLVDMRKEE